MFLLGQHSDKAASLHNFHLLETAISPFHYQPLDQARSEIRLLHIQRKDDATDDTILLDTPSNQGPQAVSYTLEQVSLGHQPYYTALSYVWGDLDDTVPMILGGQEIQITRNLHEALNHLSRACDTSTTVLWVDALGIDQSNDLEKTQQVQHMGTIYKTAATVVLRTGAEENESDRLLDKLSEIGDLATAWYIENHHRDLTAAIREDAYGDSLIARRLQEFCESEWKPYLKDLTTCPLMAFLERSYWTRVWVIQEYVFSTSAIIACGSKRHDAAIIDAGFTALSLFFNDAVRRGILPGPSSEHHSIKFTTSLTLVCAIRSGDSSRTSIPCHWDWRPFERCWHAKFLLGPQRFRVCFARSRSRKPESIEARL